MSSILANFLTSETVLATFLGVVSALWAKWGQPGVNEWIAASRWARELEALQKIAEGVVKRLYEDVVRGLKSDSPGGRILTKEERRDLLVAARNGVLAQASTLAPGIIETLGHAGIDALVERAVQAAKDRAVARQPTGRFASEEFRRILDRRNVPDGHSVAADIRAEGVRAATTVPVEDLLGLTSDPGTDAEGKQT